MFYARLRLHSWGSRGSSESLTQLSWGKPGLHPGQADQQSSLHHHASEPTEHVIFSSHCFLVSVFTLSWNHWLPCGLWSHGSGSQVVAKLTFPSTNLCPESNGSIFSLNSLLCVVRFFFFVFFSALTVRESPPQWHLNDDRWAETGVLLFLVSGRLRAETTQTALNSSRVSGRGDRTGNRPWKFRLVLKRTRVLVTRTRNLSVGGQRRTKVMGEEPHLLSHDASRALQKYPSR